MFPRSHISPEQDCPDLEGRAPLVLQNVQADATQLVHIGVVDLGQEADLGGRHRVILREEQLQLEHAAWNWHSHE